MQAYKCWCTRGMVEGRVGGRGCVPGVARARCPVFIALANRSITDSDTAQLGSPRTEGLCPCLPASLPTPLSHRTPSATLHPTSYSLDHPFRIVFFGSPFPLNLIFSLLPVKSRAGGWKREGGGSSGYWSWVLRGRKRSISISIGGF